ncbi:MAG TPA: hypothetical protein VGT61_10200 [Thermomicrobiales bacterium]|jgi:hypothetical protein|nr:hypothetical protein [Thermomicrobiales bacterium]
MWWLTLRLQRAELILLIALAIGITIPFVLTADQARLVQEQYAPRGFTEATCPGDWVTFPNGDSGCQWVPDHLYQVVDAWKMGLLGLPIAVAILLAIPVVMQLQLRTYRVAWTQSLTRGRWIVTHLALILVVGLAVTGGMILLMRWWPQDSFQYRWGPEGIDLPGIVNVGWFVFAVGLVLVLATVLRRPLIALVLAAVGFSVIRTGWTEIIRPRLIPPREETTAATGFLDQPGA